MSIPMYASRNTLGKLTCVTAGLRFSLAADSVRRFDSRNPTIEEILCGAPISFGEELFLSSRHRSMCGISLAADSCR